MTQPCPAGDLEHTLIRIVPGRRFALAFSGGMDSRFLAFMARRFGFEPVLFHASGPHVPPEETEYARLWASTHALYLHELRLNPLTLPLVSTGDRQRCYACKRFLFSTLRGQTDLPLCDGSNASDEGQHRPGLKALAELGILSPLRMAGLDKTAIRQTARQTGLEQPDQPARPCLLTRLAYGLRPEKEILARLAGAESAVRAVLKDSSGECPDFRLRLLTLHRVELHLLCRDRDRLDSRAQSLLMRQLSHFFPEVESGLRGLDTLSGFFDRA